MFDLWKLTIEAINRDWFAKMKKKRANPNITLTRHERRQLKRL